MKLELDESSKIETDVNSLGLNDSSIMNSNKITSDEGFDNIDLRIERDELVAKNDFMPNNNLRNTTKVRRYGNTFICFLNKNGDPLIVIGPHWPFYLCLSSSVSFITYLFFYYFWNYLEPGFRFFGILLYFTQISSYTYTFLKNPGIPKNKSNTYEIQDIELNKIADNSNRKNKNKGYQFCNKCHLYVDVQNNVSHCEDCNVCVEGYDHHCPWTSKCIGKGNLNGFYVFVFSTMLLFGYWILGLSIAR